MQIVKRKQKSFEVDLLAICKLLWKSKWLLLACGIVGLLAFHIVTALIVTPLYSTSATLYANNSVSSEGSTSISTSDMSASLRLVRTYSAIIMSDPVLDQVIEANGLKTSAAKLARRIEIDSVNDTEVFKITVSYSSPKTAANIANSIAQIAPEKIGEIVDGCSVKIVSLAKVPSVRSYPDYERVDWLGFLAGVGVSALIILITALMDTCIRGETDLYEWELPVLGVIPSFAETERKNANRIGYGKKEINTNGPSQT